MGLKDVFKKKEKIEDAAPSTSSSQQQQQQQQQQQHLAAPEFRFIRSDTHTEEVIHPPANPDSSPEYENDDAGSYLSAGDGPGDRRGGSSRLSLSVFKGGRGSRSASVSSTKSGTSTASTSGKEKEKESAGRRLSHRLHLSRSPASSEAVPQDLPEIVVPDGEDGAAESQWERRATMLARENEKHRSRPGSPGSTPRSPLSGPVSPIGSVSGEFARMHVGDGSSDTERAAESASQQDQDQDQGTHHNGVVSSKAIDEDIQEAIRLHDSGDFEASTAMFGRLADPKGPNNPLSQVLYGIALRHGWGCQANPEAAVSYLSMAASNAAEIENLALQAGRTKGGAAKGELTLGIFELANCFRHGWGIAVDPVAAKQYYETAANLGDTDAMNEIAWCYEKGFGTKKDMYAAAKYYRMAEDNGNKIIGNSWIRKPKYDPDKRKK